MTSSLLRFLLCLACVLPALSARAEPDLSAADAAAQAKAGKLTLVDIRTPPEWKETGVPQGATLINMLHPQGPQGFTDALLQTLKGDKDAPVALICRTGNRTTQVQRYLQSAGFTRVYNIREGMVGSAAGPGWIKRGLPVERCTQQC